MEGTNKRFIVYTWQEDEDNNVFDADAISVDKLSAVYSALEESDISGAFISVIDTHTETEDGEPKRLLWGVWPWYRTDGFFENLLDEGFEKVLI